MQKIADNISIDSIECCKIAIPKYNLFSRRKPDVSPRPQGDDNNIIDNKKDNKLYGITVNILPFKQMNKKRWYTYSHDKQREILARIETKFRKDTPSVILHELHYELCPSEDKFKNIHFHALYEMPIEFKAELETYYNRICSDNSNKNWRHIDIRLINNKQAWLDYIRKDNNI